MANYNSIKSSTAGSALNATDASLVVTARLSDNSSGDQITFDPASASANICAIIDCGNSIALGQLEVELFIANAGSMTFNGSNDGTTWTNALSGLNSTTTGWQGKTIITTGTPHLTGVAYRYYRLAITDTVDARIGDYRIYDSGLVEITLAGGDNTFVMHPLVIVAPQEPRNFQ